MDAPSAQATTPGTSGDLFGTGSVPAAQNPDPFLDFGIGSVTQQPQQSSALDSDLFGGPSSTAGSQRPSGADISDMFGGSSVQASGPSSTSDAFGGDLLGGMTQQQDISFDPFSASAPAAPVNSSRNMSSASLGGSTAASPGIDLMGGTQQSANLLGGVNGGNTFGGMQQQHYQQQPTTLNFGGMSGPASPFQVHSPTRSPIPQSPPGSFQPGVRNVDPAAMYASVNSKRAAMSQPVAAAPAGKSADPFAQLSGFGSSANKPATTATPGSRGSASATSTSTTLQTGLRSGGPSQPTSITPSPSGSGRNTPAYTSVIGHRDERGTRGGPGGKFSCSVLHICFAMVICC